MSADKYPNGDYCLYISICFSIKNFTLHQENITNRISLCLKFQWEAQWPQGLCACSRLSGLGLTPGRGHCVVFIGKTFYSHSASLQPGNLMLGVTCDGQHPIQGGEEILLDTSCYRNQDKWRPRETLPTYTFL